MLFGDIKINLLVPDRIRADYLAVIHSSNIEIINKIDIGIPTQQKQAQLIVDRAILNPKNDNIALSSKFN